MRPGVFNTLFRALRPHSRAGVRQRLLYLLCKIIIRSYEAFSEELI